MEIEKLKRLSELSKVPTHSPESLEELQSLVKQAIGELAYGNGLDCGYCVYNVPIDNCVGECETCDKCPEPCRTCENFCNIELGDGDA